MHELYNRKWLCINQATFCGLSFKYTLGELRMSQMLCCTCSQSNYSTVAIMGTCIHRYTHTRTVAHTHTHTHIHTYKQTHTILA